MKAVYTAHAELKFRILERQEEGRKGCEVSDELIDHAEEVGSIVVHFTKG